MSESNSNSGVEKGQERIPENSLEKNLAKMEALLKQSAMGIHVLFQNNEIANAFHSNPQSDLMDFNKMKRVQDVMTKLIGKQTYYEKLDFLKGLDKESYDLLIRTYFHIVENTVRANTEKHH